MKDTNMTFQIPNERINMTSTTLTRMVIILLVYLALRYLGGSVGRTILYPVTLLVTFLHEFGHALGAILTGGSVEALQINQDGSGYTRTLGGTLGVILAGGYIGSAIFGNFLFYIGARKPMMAHITMYVLSSLMLISAVFWFNSMFTTGLLVVFAMILFFIASRRVYEAEVLMFLGLASIIYIVQDFNVGPSSDLKAYADLFIFIPAVVWMYVWLGIVLILCFVNFRLILKDNNKA